jgi:hypothetical protein
LSNGRELAQRPAQGENSRRLAVSNLKESTMNPNPRTDHLEPYKFKPGNPGGPGAPKRKYVTRALELVARRRMKAEGGKKGRRYLTAAAVGMWEAAAAGDAQAFKEIRNTIQGPPEGDPESGRPAQILVQIIHLAPDAEVHASMPALDAPVVRVGE